MQTNVTTNPNKCHNKCKQMPQQMQTNSAVCVTNASNICRIKCCNICMYIYIFIYFIFWGPNPSRVVLLDKKKYFIFKKMKNSVMWFFGCNKEMARMILWIKRRNLLVFPMFCDEKSFKPLFWINTWTSPQQRLLCGVKNHKYLFTACCASLVFTDCCEDIDFSCDVCE